MSTIPKCSFYRQEAFYFHNTLLCLIKALENRYTTIDLKNEISITGKLEEVDGFMNIVVSDAAVFDTDGECRYFSFMHIQSRNIRYIHIPDNIPIKKTIKRQLINVKGTEDKKLTFKQSRAKKQQQETLKLIEELKKLKEIKTEKEIKMETENN